MPSLNRRQFLLFVGSTLATLGLSQTDFLNSSDRHARVLAQPKGRKLALLVGINQYPQGINSLRGCLMDVQLQYELLVHRYGFNPKDILILDDNSPQKPTRQNLLAAFEEHLIKQAKPGDSVIFHYSGHGSRVLDPYPIEGGDFNGRTGTLVVSDARSNLQASNLQASNLQASEVNDIMGTTLFLLTRALKTDQVSMILDSCHSGIRGLSGIRVVESRQGAGGDRPSALELAYQDKLRQTLKLSPQDVQALRQKGIANGMAFGSARISQVAADASFDGFSAGAFTYLLTRYLWQDPLPSSVESSFGRISLMTQDVAGSSGTLQTPLYEVKPDQGYNQKPIYFTPAPRPAAEAVIREVKGKQVKFWLGGVSAKSLESFTQGAVFDLIDDQGKAIGEVHQMGRDGLMGDGMLKSGSAKPGTLMREKIRGIPTNLSLRIGLDPSLGNDLAKAQTALQKVRRIQTSSLNQRGTTSTPVDFLLGRLTPTAIQRAQTRGDAPPQVTGSIGLLTRTLTPVPDSFGTSTQESIETAIARLQPRLKMLLAGRLLGAMLNSDSSSLNVKVEIRPAGSNKALSTQSSRGTDAKTLTPQSLGKSSAPVKANTQIEIAVTNQEPQNLYLGVIAIANSGDLSVIHPLNWDAPEASTLIAPNQTLVVPEKNNPSQDFRFIVQGPAGFFELLVITSTTPLRDSLKALQTIAKSRGSRSGNPLSFDENSRAPRESSDTPLAMVEAILGDLDTRAGLSVTSGNTRSLSTQGLAAFSTVIQVVD